jgi:hypothetical protein
MPHETLMPHEGRAGHRMSAVLVAAAATVLTAVVAERASDPHTERLDG